MELLGKIFGESGMNKTSLFSKREMWAGVGGEQLTSPSSKVVMLAFKRLYLVGNVLAAVSKPVISFHCSRILAQFSPLSRKVTSMRSASPASVHEVWVGKMPVFALLIFAGRLEIPSVATDALGFFFFCSLLMVLALEMVALCSGSGLMMRLCVVSSSSVMPDSGVAGAQLTWGVVVVTLGSSLTVGSSPSLFLAKAGSPSLMTALAATGFFLRGDSF